LSKDVEVRSRGLIRRCVVEHDNFILMQTWIHLVEVVRPHSIWRRGKSLVVQVLVKVRIGDVVGLPFVRLHVAIVLVLNDVH
jgi:hypothetical protein